MINLLEILKHIAVIMTSIAGLKASRKKLRERREEKIRSKNQIAHRAIAAVYPVMYEALNKFESIDRVTVFRSHNGNGIPAVGSPCHTSCIQEVHTDKTTPITSRWQAIPNDSLMVDMISELMQSGSCAVRIDDGTAGILADFAKGNNIQSVLAVPVAYMDTGFVFLNFCSSSTDLSRVGGVLFEARSVAARIKSIIETSKH